MTWLFKNYFSKNCLLNPHLLGLEYKYIPMTTDIWTFQDSSHPFHKVTLGKLEEAAGEDAWFDFFQKHQHEIRTSIPTSIQSLQGWGFCVCLCFLFVCFLF